MRLVQKLQGGKQRHARSVQNGLLDPTATSATVHGGNRREGEGDSAEEEETTRASGAIRKRPRVVDPFESGGMNKNRKRMKKVVVAESAETVGAVPATKDVAVEEAPPRGGVVATIDATTDSSPKKRKKKKKKGKKHKTEPVPDDQEARGHTEGLGEPIADVLPVGGLPQSLLEEWEGIEEFQERSRSGTPTSPPSSHSGMFYCWTPHVNATLSCFRPSARCDTDLPPQELFRPTSVLHHPRYLRNQSGNRLGFLRFDDSLRPRTPQPIRRFHRHS
jgi:hypothetical protein